MACCDALMLQQDRHRIPVTLTERPRSFLWLKLSGKWRCWQVVPETPAPEATIVLDSDHVWDSKVVLLLLRFTLPSRAILTRPWRFPLLSYISFSTCLSALFCSPCTFFSVHLQDVVSTHRRRTSIRARESRNRTPRLLSQFLSLVAWKQTGPTDRRKRCSSATSCSTI